MRRCLNWDWTWTGCTASERIVRTSSCDVPCESLVGSGRGGCTATTTTTMWGVDEIIDELRRLEKACYIFKNNKFISYKFPFHHPKSGQPTYLLCCQILFFLLRAFWCIYGVLFKLVLCLLDSAVVVAH